MTDPGQLTFTIAPEDVGSSDGKVRLEVFISGLDSIRRALSRFDRNASEDSKPSTAFDVVSLSLNSPATVILEPRAVSPAFDARRRIVSEFMRNAEMLERGVTILPNFDRSVLEILKEAAEGARRQAVKMDLWSGSYHLAFNAGLERRVERLLAQEEGVYSSIEGVLEKVNFHANANICTVFPLYGPDRVTCHFDRDLRQQVNNAVLKHVRVTGMVWSDRDGGFPHRVDLDEIEMLADVGGRPSLTELRGIGEDFQSGRQIEDFLRVSRDGWA